MFTDQSTVPLLLLIGIVLLCVIPFTCFILVLRNAAAKINVTNIMLCTDGLEVVLLDGRKLSKNWHEVSSFRKCGMKYEITCKNSDKFILPAYHPIIPIIELIQQDFFPECIKKETLATRRFIIRSCVMLWGGCMITSVILSYLEGIEPVTTNELGAIATLLLFGLVAPSSMILIMWLATTFDPHIRERVRRKKSWSIKL